MDDDKLELDWGGRQERDAKNAPPASTGREPSQPSALTQTRGEPQKKSPLPGNPADMPESMRYRVARFFEGASLRISQRVELAQALVGWDEANQYDVKGDDNASMFTAVEQGGGVLGALNRNFNPFYKNVTECLTPEGSLVLRLTFPFTFFFRRCEVSTWDERPLGAVQNRFHLLKFRSDLVNTAGVTQLEVHGPMFKLLSFTDWVFEVRRGEQVVARIKKHWGGFFREAFTSSDRLSVEFEPGFTDPRLRQLVFAAALDVDLTSFEKSDRHASGKNLLQMFFD